MTLEGALSEWPRHAAERKTLLDLLSSEKTLPFLEFDEVAVLDILDMKCIKITTIAQQLKADLSSSCTCRQGKGEEKRRTPATSARTSEISRSIGEI